MSIKNSHEDSGGGARRPRLSVTLLLAVVAVVGLGAVAVSAYGGSDSESTGGAEDLSGKAKAGFEEFRQCMRGEGVEPPTTGPPAESEKTDEMRAAFEKCRHLIRRGDGEGKAEGFADFRDCMAAEGVEVSPDGPPAESEKTDKMRAAFEKCKQHIPEHIREGGGPGGPGGGASFGGEGPPTSAL